MDTLHDIQDDLGTALISAEEVVKKIQEAEADLSTLIGQEDTSGDTGDTTEPDPPPMPQDLSIKITDTRAEAVTIKLSWPSVDNVDGYRVTAGVGDPTEDTVVGGTEYTFDHQRKTEKVTLWACVRGVRGDVEGEKRCNNTQIPAKETQTTEPDPGLEPIVEFDPDMFESTEELMAFPNPVFDSPEIGEHIKGDPDDRQNRAGVILLDKDVAHPGGNSSMVYEYRNQGVYCDGGKGSLHVGKHISLPKRLREIWVRFDARWSKNFFDFQVDPDNQPSGCTAAHKLFFVRTKNLTRAKNWLTDEGCQVGRWANYVPSGGNPIDKTRKDSWDVDAPVLENCEYADIPDSDFQVENLFDENWHDIRFHFAHDPGQVELWVDGEKVYDVSGFIVDSDLQMTDLLPGRNKDEGLENGTEKLWWGRIRAYDQNPGW